ncbi:MAG: thioredoxin family protein [Chloroflexi bacterium]|nr:MAG: thioredoxin family protein [Chloroflexota bacterium]
MTQQKESVVTPERFASGLTWSEYLEQRVQRNREKFNYNYDETVLGEDDAAAFKRLVQQPGGPAKVLALGEDWCPDVFRGLPVVARIAEASGMELRMFPRDDNLDIMNEFLNHGESQSIPTFVFYTADHRYIAHWIERPAKANAEMGEVQKLFAGLDREKDRDKMRDMYNDFQQGPIWGSWREETVRELRSLLEEKASS